MATNVSQTTVFYNVVGQDHTVQCSAEVSSLTAISCLQEEIQHTSKDMPRSMVRSVRSVASLVKGSSQIGTAGRARLMRLPATSETPSK